MDIKDQFTQLPHTLSKLKIPRIRVIQPKRKNEPGQVPGTYTISSTALSSKIFVYSYDEEHLDEFQTKSIKEALEFTALYRGRSHWIDIKGLGTQKVLNTMQTHFNVNPLVLEDIVNTYQRPKMEDYEDYLFVTSRMLELDRGLQLKNEQLSFLLFPNLIISFQEDYDDVLDPVRNRLKKGAKGNIRTLGTSYLLYALMDTVIDHYFTIANRLGEELEMIEDHLYQKPMKLLMYRIQGVKKLVISMRRAAWPEREKLTELLKSNSALINEDTKVFIRDAYDHSIQVIDLIENMRETATSLLDLYLSLMSNKMNEVMKTLTIISAIFIPLTFIAGIYGMNFQRQDPITGKVLPNNMPELYIHNGYLYVLGGMLLITAFQIWYFAKKGWFKD